MKNGLYKKILVTGGAGFIGSFLVDRLINEGFDVRIFDNLERQVHQGKKPSYLNPKAEFLKRDVKDYAAFDKALDNIDIIFHLAARVGVGQSNYEIKDYIDTNIGGMVNLLDIVVNKKTTVKKIIMIASMTSYGEGDYMCQTCGVVKPSLRKESQLKEKDWELHCPNCQKYIKPIPTKETSALNNNSIYALSKRTQEEMLLLIGNMYKIPVVSLRCFNVYGPRQSLSNPYTGVSAIFLSRIKNKNSPVMYEDGLQTRDFISVHDVVDTLILSMEKPSVDYQIVNIASGKPTSIQKIAKLINKLVGSNVKANITENFRKNDIRHCYADISKVQKLLSWKPKVTLEQGFRELIAWSSNEKAIDLFDKAAKELHEKHLA